MFGNRYCNENLHFLYCSIKNYNFCDVKKCNMHRRRRWWWCWFHNLWSRSSSKKETTPMTRFFLLVWYNFCRIFIVGKNPRRSFLFSLFKTKRSKSFYYRLWATDCFLKSPSCWLAWLTIREYIYVTRKIFGIFLLLTLKVGCIWPVTFLSKKKYFLFDRSQMASRSISGN